MSKLDKFYQASIFSNYPDLMVECVKKSIEEDEKKEKDCSERDRSVEISEAKNFKAMQKEALGHLMAAYKSLSEFESMDIGGGAAANEAIGSLIEKVKKMKG